MGRGLSPSNKRHSGRRQCSYCGVTLTPSHGGPFAPKPGASASKIQRYQDQKTWDHIVPRSAGGALTIPTCSWCNGKKGDVSLSDWLSSDALRLRRSVVLQREPDAEPMNEGILYSLRDECIATIRRNFEYHSR